MSEERAVYEAAPCRVTEKAFMQAVIDYARLRGWIVFHPFDSRRSEPGYPDLTLCRPPVVRVVELKVGRNRPTARQRAWLETFRACGIPADVWTPDMWDVIEQELA